LSSTLTLLGVPHSIDISRVFLFGDQHDEFSEFLARLPRDLNEVWIDPQVANSLGLSKTGTKSIKLLDQCYARIKDGHLATWLAVGKYYLATGSGSAGLKWLQEAAEAGIADADVLVGHAYKTGLISSVKDEKLAFIHYMKAANAGSAKGQFYVGEFMASVNPQTARKYIVASAHGGSLAAAC